ncbi:MAG: glycosyltransferase family 2 protein, partial [Gemmatimonadetes bacterium]|nr:glycosyltransferase family 2 protein [Gemmatimonadota bacterium]
MNESISIVIPTKDGGPAFGYLRRHLQAVRERHGVQVLVIDSGSSDTTAQDAERDGFRVQRIPPQEFGHGRTRNLGVRLAQGDVVCFLTQDVLPCTLDWPLVFARALEDPRVAGVYGRQVPRDASTMEMFFVALNYPEQPMRFEPAAHWH